MFSLGYAARNIANMQYFLQRTLLLQLSFYWVELISNTVGSRIVRAHEIIRNKNLISNLVLLKNICQAMIFRLYTVYNKHEIIKIGNQTREKLQVLS